MGVYIKVHFPEEVSIHLGTMHKGATVLMPSGYMLGAWVNTSIACRGSPRYADLRYMSLYRITQRLGDVKDLRQILTDKLVWSYLVQCRFPETLRDRYGDRAAHTGKRTVVEFRPHRSMKNWEILTNSLNGNLEQSEVIDFEASKHEGRAEAI